MLQPIVEHVFVNRKRMKYPATRFVPALDFVEIKAIHYFICGLEKFSYCILLQRCKENKLQAWCWTDT